MLLLAVGGALGTWLTSNLGGFLLGMLLALVGGALAFGWTLDEGPRQPDRVESAIELNRGGGAIE